MKVGIPKGTRDFSPVEIANRNYIFNTIKKAFELYGFQPIETPSFENSSTLMGKYGEEGDRLIFKILNSGDYFKDIRKKIFDQGELTNIFYSIFEIFEKLLDIQSTEFDSVFDSLVDLVRNYNGVEDKTKEILLSVLKNRESDVVEYFDSYVKKNNEFPTDLNKSLTFKINFLDKILSDYFNKLKILDSTKDTSKISEKALRYDLTVPFARYVVQHQNEITFPFKRYQIQPVWRADRPQKGRFREFYQCDADVVGSKSLLQEVEFVQLYDKVFTDLGLQGTTIKINNRKILSGIAEVIGAKDKLIDFTVALDKLDKIGKDGVVKEMLAKGIAEDAIAKVEPLFNFTGSNKDKLTSLETLLATSEEGKNGVEELRFVVNSIEELGLQSAKLELDVTLARGLNYYTGAIYEVSAPEGVKMGSIGGGGRYDDLTGIFGLKDVSGIGISFGLDRIYLVLEELGLFKSVELPKPEVLFLNFDEAENIAKIKLIKTLRDNNIKAELYPDTATSNNQQKKQWKYADKRAIEFVVTALEDNKLVVKQNREQTLLTVQELIEKLKK